MTDADPTDVFVIIHQDRHMDTGVEVWADEGGAIERASCLARESCRFDEDFNEGLTAPMVQAGWLYHATYSCEGDSVRVVKAELHRELMTDAEAQCQNPCDPDVGCEQCAGYWSLMESEGYWDRGAHRWTDKGWREIVMGAK